MIYGNNLLNLRTQFQIINEISETVKSIKVGNNTDEMTFYG